MKSGDLLKTTMLIRSQKTGALLPRQGTFVRDIENLGRKLILVDFGPTGVEYLLPNEVMSEPPTPTRLIENQTCENNFTKNGVLGTLR